MSLTIAEYFDRLATQGLGIYISEEFDNAIVDTLEIIQNHDIGDFENVEEEFLDKPSWEEEEDV
tara:strand:- start:707 stop:898 length:192 start_codon:yes stop_codon:yes gene_type:complete